MPLVNESQNADVEYLSDGMTETLIKSLSNLSSLDVKPRSSVFRYKGKDTDLQTIAKELSVQAIQEAENIIERFREIAKTQYVMSYHLALIYSTLGDKDKAIAELENAFNEHDYLLPRIKVEPFLDPLHTDPRFKELIKRMRFP